MGSRFLRTESKLGSGFPGTEPETDTPMCEDEDEHTLNVTLTLKVTQQSSNKRTKEVQEVNTVNRVKELKGA